MSRRLDWDRARQRDQAAEIPVPERHEWERDLLPVAPDPGMTAKQRQYLKALCKRAGRTFDASLSRYEASALIDQLRGPVPRKGKRKPSQNALAVKCPTCSAPAGTSCWDPRGGTARKCCAARRRAAQ